MTPDQSQVEDMPLDSSVSISQKPLYTSVLVDHVVRPDALREGEVAVLDIWPRVSV